MSVLHRLSGVSARPTPTIVIHGGAGIISRSKMTPAEERAIRRGLYHAALEGYTVLRRGESAVDAVEIAVRSLENNPTFNAGKGSIFNIDGVNQMEASVIDGSNGMAGAVTLLTVVKNPVSLARRVMEGNQNLSMCGSGAEKFANNEGLDIFDYSHLITGTVGAVAIDVCGRLAAATLTGGTTNKLDKCLDNTSAIGAGTWADSKVAVSCAGTSKNATHQGTSRYIASHVDILGENASKASAIAINEIKNWAGMAGSFAWTPRADFR
ncbi:putative asparaginase [Kickxella alabastrina]|uniref:putative asparaginase n=1 Tax=Kickxella alabastrina TaxID=61397 RepID=UPI00221F73D9|nr:putative asparaginase [Kickxella alabastrina]KAI7828415.1 putative asparaginase [Kickxella alabastrina]